MLLGFRKPLKESIHFHSNFLYTSFTVDGNAPANKLNSQLSPIGTQVGEYLSSFRPSIQLLKFWLHKSYEVLQERLLEDGL